MMGLWGSEESRLHSLGSEGSEKDGCLERATLATIWRTNPVTEASGGALSHPLWKQAGCLTKAHFLPVRPRYSREVDGQRLSAKVDDKVCCFSPVRRSITYQMSCFLPGMLMDTVLTFIPSGNNQHCQGSSSNHSRSFLCWETGLKSLGC